MRLIHALIITCLLCFSTPLHASDDLMEAGRTTTIDFLLEQAISRGLIAGGVVVIGNHDGSLYTSSRGRLNTDVNSPLITERTIFDVASLTKVLATTPAIMKLLEDGRITLMDPLTRWFPEFNGSGHENITILNLLTHSSGLDDIAVAVEDPIKTTLQKVAAQKNRNKPGSHFRYADINFILLGELVRRSSGITLDVFCNDRIYNPMGTHETMFLPPRELAGSIASTMGSSREFSSGIVQDENARRLGCVAGHAGLFSSAADIALFSRMMLGGGMLNGKRIFPEQVLSQMTTPYFYSNGTVVRGLGWDIESPYSAPKGNFFSKMSFGHTGYSGSSIWIDPQRDLFVILLTTRLDYRDTRLFSRLRSNISTLAMEAFRQSGRDLALSAAAQRTH